MDLPLRFTFVHIENRDGTIDSICLQCHTTVYKSFWEADLDQAETLHACNSDPLVPGSPFLRRAASIIPSCSQQF